MKIITSFLLILSVILLVACQNDSPQATAIPEPTVVAADAPVEEASPETAEEPKSPETTAAPTAMPMEEPATEEPTAEDAEAGDATTNMSDEQLEMMAAIAPPPQLSDREPGVDSVSCSPGVLSGNNLVEGEDYTCGVFTVPQNWEEPDGRNLDLSYVVVNATGGNPEPDPILYLAGGPGSSAILTKDINKYQNLRPDRDLIIFDIRGVGLSQRLSFEECLVLAMQNDAPADQIEALRTAAPNLLAKVSGEGGVGAPSVADQDLPVLNEICWAQFTTQGLDLNQFSTASNARDAVELVKALGYESFNLDSVSYGTRHAMTIMDDMPGYDDAPQLRSAVLDSAFPPSVYLIRTIVRSDHDFMLQLLEECQADSACNKAYPNLKERLAALLNNLEEAPVTSNGETATLDDVVTQLRDTGGTLAAYLPKMIDELETGVLDTYLALRDGEVGADLEAITLSVSAAAEALDLNDPVQAFVAAALDLLSPEEALFFPVYFQLVVAEEDPLAVLPEFITESFPGETADQLLAFSGTLTTEDFANSPYVAQLQAETAAASDPEAQLVSMREGNAKGMAQLLYSSIHCIDDILNESFEDAVDSYNSLAFPQLTDLDRSQVFAERCENWLVDPAPIEVKGPVTSAVRALILQGAYDKSTPVYMGQTAASELENSTYVYVPQEGHETWRNAENCLGQIVTAFVQDPETELDLACLDARKPQWVLPGDGELATGQLVADQMVNATYGGIYDAPVTLIDGVYEGEPFVEGGASRPVVTYIDNTLAHGELDGDGLDDAVALLIENSGGSGTFSYVGAQLNRDGQPADAGAALLGDRVQLISMGISDGQVTAEIVTQGPDEGLCCGTLKMRKTLGLQDGQLAEVASEELGPVSLDDLMGTQWRLHRLNFDQEPLVDVTISAEFAEGTVSGTGGCNSYSADVTSSGGQLLAVAPVATTAMACDDELEALETEYLAALQSATEWRFYPGQLAIGYTATGGDQATLFFNPAESAGADTVLD